MNRKTTMLTVGAAALFLILSGAAHAEADLEAGKVTFTTVCFTCHGMTGKGDGPVGAMLQPPPRDFSKAEFKFDADGDGTPGTDADLKAVIRQGAGAFGGSPLMAPNPTLSDEDLVNVIAFVRSLQAAE